jgi:broad specificity phosphatase PhoE
VSSKKRTIIVDLLRHGQPEGGEVLRGRIDHPLTETGWQQMKLVTAIDAMLDNDAATSPWTELITSPLQRCRQFAEYTSRQTELILNIDTDWQEIDYGTWDGMLLSDWRKEAANQFREFRKDLSKLAPPEGEDYLTFRDRIVGAWDAIAAKPDGTHVLIVTHGGVMRVVLPTVLGMPLNRSYPLHIPYACLSRISLEVEEGKVSASLLSHNAPINIPI